MMCRTKFAVYSKINTKHSTQSVHNVEFVNINPLTPKDSYRGRTAPLTSKVTFYIFIQQM